MNRVLKGNFVKKFINKIKKLIRSSVFVGPKSNSIKGKHVCIVKIKVR